MARGSLLELETQIQIARDPDYVDEADGEHLLSELLAVVRPLHGLIAKIREEQFECLH
jgi:four helix bundle protein